MSSKKPIILAAALFLCALMSCSPRQKTYHPEDIIETFEGHHLKYKHLQAYVNKNGGDLGIPTYLSEKNLETVKAKVIREFFLIPEELVRDLDDHYDWMKSLGVIELVEEYPRGLKSLP